MTRQISQKTISTASGLTAGLNTPCQFHKFSTGLLGELFETSLPKYLQEMRSKWGEIQCTRVSGLAPTFEGGPVDDCVRQGSWCEQQQLAHGGPIPFLSCSKGSRGVIQPWPYFQQQTKSWTQVGHGRYEPTQGQNFLNLHEQAFHAEDYHDMDWAVGRRTWQEQKKFSYHDWVGTFGPRWRPWRPHKHSAGAKRKRHSGKVIRPRDSEGEPSEEEPRLSASTRNETLSIFFANITSCSEKAKHKIISLGDDVV